jgi:hypothetical protein
VVAEIEPIEPIRLVCVRCGIVHNDFSAESHKCCSESLVIPKEIYRLIDDVEVLENVAHLISREYHSSDFTYIDVNTPGFIILENPSANEASIRLPIDIIDVLKPLDHKTSIIIAPLLSDFLAREHRPHNPAMLISCPPLPLEY